MYGYMCVDVNIHICVYIYPVHTYTYISRVATKHGMPPKLQVSLCKRANTYRALLRKKTYKDNASYGSSPPCMQWTVSTRICC